MCLFLVYSFEIKIKYYRLILGAIKLILRSEQLTDLHYVIKIKKIHGTTIK